MAVKIPSLHIPLKPPVQILRLNNCPKIIAGGIPVTPFNVVLERRRRLKNATDDSLDTYTRAGRLYAEFCAHLGRSIIDISDADFSIFKGALVGDVFKDSKGELRSLVGERKRGGRTADTMISLLYSIAHDIEELYMEHFDWLRYSPSGYSPSGLFSTRNMDRHSFTSSHPPRIGAPRAHRIKWTPARIVGIPDDQFALMLDVARELWANTIPDGDAAYADDPESRRGALYFRNAAILFLLRYEGSRRREATFVEFGDIRRDESKLYLVTKGHGGETGERLPVLLFPFVDELIWRYVIKYRPIPSRLHKNASQRIFLSHSLRNYGQPITKETVRKIVDTLRVRLDPPWDRRVTPHTLRHAFARYLQRHGGPFSTTVNLRHRSLSSSQPYMSDVETFSEDLLSVAEDELAQLLSMSGLLSLLKGEEH